MGVNVRMVGLGENSEDIEEKAEGRRQRAKIRKKEEGRRKEAG